MDFRKQHREHPPIHIDGTVVEKVESFKFFGVGQYRSIKAGTARLKYSFYLKAIRLLRAITYSERLLPT